MKKDDYVQFTGTLPKKLQGKGLDSDTFGRIIKLVEKTKAIVKPRYRHFEVTVNIADIIIATKKAYQGKAAKEALKKVVIEEVKKPVAKPVVKKVTKTVEKPIEKKSDDSWKEEADVQDEASIKEIPKHNPVPKIKVAPPIPSTSEATQPVEEEIVDDVHVPESGGVIIYGAIAIFIIAAAVGIYLMCNIN